MNSDWQAYLQSQHALIEDGRVAHFGNAAAELISTRTATATVLSDLSHFDLIQFTGEDAQSFLQGQVTCDLSRIGSSAAGSSSASYGGYCNPKGRMLASFMLWQMVTAISCSCRVNCVPVYRNAYQCMCCAPKSGSAMLAMRWCAWDLPAMTPRSLSSVFLASFRRFASE